MTDEELRYWLDRGEDMTLDTPLVGDSKALEVITIWRVIAAIGKKVLSG